MGWWRLSARRARRQASLLLAVAAVTALVTGGLSVVLAVGDDALRDGARGIVAAATPQAAAVRLETAYDLDDPDGQTAEVDAVLAGALRDAPVRVDRTVTALPVPLPDGRSVVLTWFPADHEVRVLSGAWPVDAGQTAVSTGAAERLDVAVGDRIATGVGDLDVVGVWEARDVHSARWNADPLIRRGESAEGLGPLVVAEPVLADVARADVSWTIRPEPSALSVATVPGLLLAFERLRAAIPDIGDGSDAVTLDGALDGTLDRVVRADATARALAAVPITLLLVVCTLVLALLGRELGAARAPDTVLMRSRGASARALTAVVGVEALAAAAVGAAVGAAVVAGSSALGVPARVDTVIVVAGAAVAGATSTLLVAGRPRWEPAREPSGRAAVLADLGVLLPLVAVTVLAVAQLHSGGLVHGGLDAVDPLAAGAPSLLVVALLLIARIFVGPVLGAAALVAARGRGLLPVYPLRQLARRARSVSAGLLVIALGAAGILFAATVQRTVAASDARAVSAVVVADARVRFAPRDLPDDLTGLAEAIGGSDGVDAVLPALVSEGDLGGSPVDVVAADVDSVARRAPGFALPDRVGDDPARLDAVITDDLARRAALRVGDSAHLAMRGVPPELPLEVAAVVADIPAGVGPDGVFLDRADLDAAVEAAGATPPGDDELWVHGHGPLEDTVSAALPVRAEVVTPTAVSDGPVLGAVAGLSWATAAATGVVGMLGFIAVLAALARARAPEVLPLRVAGASPRLQGRSRFVETVGLAALGGVTGAAGGVAAAVFTVPLATASIARAAPGVEWPPVAWAALAGAAVALAIGGAAARAVQRLASAPSRREGL
ncbi:hypothetical protein CLV46_1448 [Diaminobutyricimonas aerilata]|uniref:FtsX-like permease family protein n=2 Tax=Diaminobutyricimonas aerilata TaxID=1162967 RepID=A0A2M9CJ20_9MICO|nr:hypothetical protein CLV46_1448 [Diaminobutyricimonas aerilata]